MIHAWLEFSLPGIFAVLAVLYAVTGGLIFWLTYYSPLGKTIRSCKGLTPSYFGAVAVLFGLLTGFLTADISDRNRQATRTVQAESEALTSMYALSIASASDMANIRNAIRAYTKSVLEDEWPLIARGDGAVKTEIALNALLQSVADPKIAGPAGQAVTNALVNLSLRVSGARSDRLALGADRSYDLKWFTVLFLCFMTQVALAAVHLEKPRPQAAALAIFSVAAIVALALIAEQESPFDGTLQVSRAPLEQVLKLAPAPNNPNG
jgi:uncharacterized protein DUF4239